MSNLFSLINITCIIIFLSLGVFYLIVNRDRFKNPEEYKTKGSSGERVTYLALLKLGIPENQILRNIYIPTSNGTTEIDLIVVSKKGILVFECKNYSGRIYGDGNKQKWVQYIGGQKNYFLSPIVQNRGHVKRVKEYFDSIESLPVIPFFTRTNNANWKLKNINPEDHVLEAGDFKKIYAKLKDSDVMAKNYNKILEQLKTLERPDSQVCQRHIENIKKKQNK